MIKYRDYLKESSGPELDKKYGFFMFLKNIDEMKFKFQKTNHYLNVGKYLYFFTTEQIRKKDLFLDLFTGCMSIKTTCETAQDIVEKRVSFYFAVKGNNLEYGFHDDNTRDIYKTGEFGVNDRYIKSIRSYKCLALIQSILKNCNIRNLILLGEIKIHFKHWYEDMGKTIILNEHILKKSVSKEDLKEDMRFQNALLKKYEKWCEKFKWVDKVYYYIDEDDNDFVTFYIKVKPKKSEQEY
jgi:hypothetical protein